jgi:formylglycine-generating enzyme required for sulfatase activity
MKEKTMVLILLLTTLSITTGCAGQPASQSVTGATANPAAVTLIPYTSREFGLTGVAPSGWVEFNPGHFQPAVPGTAPTLFAQLGLPGVTLEQVVELATLPESTGSVETSSLSWTLYAWELQVPDEESIAMEIALAGSEDGVYAVVLGALGEDRDALRQVLFRPALEALEPATISEGDQDGQPQATEVALLSTGPNPLDTRIRAADGMTMVYVPVGEFSMGADAVWRWSGSFVDGTLGLMALADQRPEHTAYLDAYWIDQTEVTVAMFRTFVEATGYETMAERQGYGHPYEPGPVEQEWPEVAGADWQHPRGPGSEAQDDRPVVQVSWDDAAAYCEWVGGALPTEAQWEKACRGTDARAYPWGDEFDDRRLNACAGECPVTRWRQRPAFDDGYPYTAPVGSFPVGASPYGALDMAGNVWEWTADRYDSHYYGSSPDKNPTGPETGTQHVQHGGAWYDVGRSGWLACTIRHATVPDNTADDLGFRCAMPTDQ